MRAESSMAGILFRATIGNPIDRVSEIRYKADMEQASGIETLRAVVREMFENQTDFARAIEKPQSSVNEVLTGKRKKVPADWCRPIEEATRGRVTRSQLRPDLWPDAERPQ